MSPSDFLSVSNEPTRCGPFASFLQCSPLTTSAPFRAGYLSRQASSPIRRVIRELTLRAFLWPFDLPAFASWLILFPLRSWAALTIGLPVFSVTWEYRTALGFPRSTRLRNDWGGCHLNAGTSVSLHLRDEKQMPLVVFAVVPS